MGLKNSKSRGSKGYDHVNTFDEVSATATSTVVTEHRPSHEDPVTSVDSFGPGICLTGSKDKVSILSLQSVLLVVFCRLRCKIC